MERRPRLFTQHPELHALCEEQHAAHRHAHAHKSVRGCCHLCPKKLRDGGGTCQPVGPEDAEAGGKEREGVDEVHAEVEDALQQHHQQAQLQ